LEGEDVVLKVVDDITYNRTGNDYGREYSWPDSWHYGTKEEADELLRVYYQNKKILELADSKNDFKVPFKDFYFDTTDENRQALMFEDGEYECVVPNHSDVRNFENVYYWEANKSWYAVRIRENKEFCQK
jgi:hypothetical protein